MGSLRVVATAQKNQTIRHLSLAMAIIRGWINTTERLRRHFITLMMWRGAFFTKHSARGNVRHLERAPTTTSLAKHTPHPIASPPRINKAATHVCIDSWKATREFSRAGLWRAARCSLLSRLLFRKAAALLGWTGCTPPVRPACSPRPAPPKRKASAHPGKQLF